MSVTFYTRPRQSCRVQGLLCQADLTSPLQLGASILPETVLWNYVIQLASGSVLGLSPARTGNTDACVPAALRMVHSANMAVRAVNPDKIIVMSRSK